MQSTLNYRGGPSFKLQQFELQLLEKNGLGEGGQFCDVESMFSFHYFLSARLTVALMRPKFVRNLFRCVIIRLMCNRGPFISVAEN